MQLNFKVEEQTLTWVNREKTPVADSVRYLTAKFTFSEEWTDIEKTATFFTSNGKPYSQLLVDDWCEVPHEVIKAPLFKVSVAGGDLITTNIIIVNIIKSGYVQGETPKPPTPDVYNQILEKVTHTEEIAESVVEGENKRVSAESGRVTAESIRQENEKNRIEAEKQREALKEELEKTAVTKEELNKHQGIDVGRKGEGFESVKFNSDDNETTGYKSLAGGAKNKVSGAQGVVFGYGNNNGGQNSMAIGYNNEIEEGASDASMAVGVNNKVKNRGIAVGRGLITSPRESTKMQVVLGNYNEEESDATLIIGYGTTNNRKNAVVVYDDGSVKVKEVKGDLVVDGTVIAENTYPQEIAFDVSGENITNESGEIVAVYGKYNGIYQFDFSVNGSDGLLIKNCTELNVPVLETVLKKGTYSNIVLSVSGTTMNTYISACGYVAEFPEDVSDNIIKTSGGLQVIEDVIVNEVILKTTSEKIAATKYKGYKFSGKSKIETSVDLLIDIIPESISALREYKEPDGVSSSLHLTSPNGTVFKITVSDNGTLTTTKA